MESFIPPDPCLCTVLLEHLRITTTFPYFPLWKAFHKKKNWLFVGEADAGERAAIIYTLIESCRRRGIDPYAYLKDVLTRLHKMTNHQIPEVTPAAWAKAHLPLQRQQAS